MDRANTLLTGKGMLRASADALRANVREARRGSLRGRSRHVLLNHLSERTLLFKLIPERRVHGVQITGRMELGKDRTNVGSYVNDGVNMRRRFAENGRTGASGATTMREGHS